MNCANCGASNPDNNWKCVNCGSPLSFLDARFPSSIEASTNLINPSAKSQRICSRCGTWNPDLNVCCYQCGMKLTDGKVSWSSATQKILLNVALWIGALIVCFILIVTVPVSINQSGILDQLALTGSRQPTQNPTTPGVRSIAPTIAQPVLLPAPLFAPTAKPTRPLQICQNLQATVSLEVPVDGRSAVSGGSGSVITTLGHILTNLHVVANPDTGRPYNTQQVARVYVTTQANRPPQFAYIAHIERLDAPNDLALLRISARSNGGLLPADLNLPALPIGDSDYVSVGDELSITGYPALGGDTVTCNTGRISGFTNGFMKTDAQLNPGNSGGSAVNMNGDLVGVPTEIFFNPYYVGKVGLIRPINVARPLINLAIQDAGR